MTIRLQTQNMLWRGLIHLTQVKELYTDTEAHVPQQEVFFQQQSLIILTLETLLPFNYSLPIGLYAAPTATAVPQWGQVYICEVLKSRLYLPIIVSFWKIKKQSQIQAGGSTAEVLKLSHTDQPVISNFIPIPSQFHSKFCSAGEHVARLSATTPESDLGS